MRESLGKKLTMYLILFVFPFIVYSPVIRTNYAFLDDYTVTAFGMQGIQTHTIGQAIESGRPISAAFIRMVFGLVRGISDLRWVRAFGIAGIGVLDIVAYRALVKVGTDAPTAFCVALMLGLMPSYQVFASWAVASPYPWAALVAAVAFNVQDTVGLDWRRTIISLLLLTAATAVYQPAGMVFWVFAAIAWLIPGRLPSIRQLLSAALIMVSAMVADFALMKVLPVVLFHSMTRFARADLTHDVGGKIFWFFANPLFDALNLFSIEPSIRFASLLGFICIAGLIAGFRRKTVFALAIALVLLPAAYVPNLVTAEDWSSYRTQVALGGVVLIIALTGVLGLARALTVDRFVPLLGAAVLGWAALSGHLSVKCDFAQSSAAEYQLISQSILAAKFQAGDHACFKSPTTVPEMATDHRYDEFGTFSSSASWVLDPMAWLILNSQHSKDARIFSNFSQFPNTQVLPGCKRIDLQSVLKQIGKHAP